MSVGTREAMGDVSAVSAGVAAGFATVGYLLADEQDFASAALAFREAVGLGGAAAHWAALGFCEQKRGRLDDAVAAYRCAIDAGAGDTQLWANLGEALVDLAHYGAAVDALEQAIRTASKRDIAAAMRAKALLLKVSRDLKGA